MKAPGTTGAAKASKAGSALDQAKEASAGLEEIMRKAIEASGCKNVAEFKRLPSEEQNAFIAQARGMKTMPMRDGVQQYDPNTIRRSPFNRKINTKSPGFLKLLERVKNEGVLQNGIIRPVNPPDGKIAWEIIAGERRWTAASISKQLFPAAVRDCSDLEALEIQAVENSHREDLNPIDEAMKFDQLLEAYGKQGMKKADAIAAIMSTTGKGESTVYERLSLLSLPPVVQSMVTEERLPASLAALVTKLKEPENRTALARSYVDPANCKGNKVVSYRDAEKMVVLAVKAEKNLAAWEKQKEECLASGGTVLTPEQSKRIIGGVNEDTGYWWFHHTGGEKYVKADSQCSLPGAGYREYGKLWKKAPPATLARLSNNLGVHIYPIDIANSAVMSGGKLNKAASGRASSLSPKEVAANAAHRRRGKEFNDVMARVMTGLECTLDSSQFWKFFAHCLVRQWRSDPIRRMAKRRGWNRGDHRASGIHAEIDRMGVQELRGLCSEILLWQDAPSTWGKEWGTSITEACAITKVALPAWSDKAAAKDSQAPGNDEED